MNPLPPDESRGYIINIVAWTGVALSTPFILLRVCSRLFVTRSLGWSDGIIVLAGILNIISVALTSVAISYGLGRHNVHIPIENVVPTLYYGAILRPIGITAYCLPKLSVVTLLIGLMGPVRRGVWFLWLVIAILFITSALSFILLFAQCNPPDHLWHPFDEAECFPDYILDAVTYAAGSWSAFTDLILATYPTVLLWNLQMKPSKKISVMAIMGLGFFAMIAAIIKTTQLPANHSKDASWDLFGLFITTYIETDLVIIAACAPTLPKLVMRILGRDENSTDQSISKRSVSRGYQAFDIQNPPIRMNVIHVEGPSSRDGVV